MKKYVVDTHALVWHLANDPRLGENARNIFDNDDNVLLIPAIVLAEAKYIADKKRIPISFLEIIEALMKDQRANVYALDMQVILHLPMGLNIHDSLIVATAFFHQEFFGEEVQVITKDEQIMKSGLVDTIW